MDDEVKNYYDENSEKEWRRLEEPYPAIEFESTKYLIHKYFPSSGNVCDIGCGPGRYSIELLKTGYEVTLYDLSAKELELAHRYIDSKQLKAKEYICEDATNMNILTSNEYDGILLMGPMYHVLSEQDRLKILRETYRVLKTDGIAIIAYLNSWGILKAGVTEFSDEFENIENIYMYLRKEKVETNEGFTSLNISNPIEAISEVKKAGFEVISYAGAEGFLSGIEESILQIHKENIKVYNNLVKVASENCECKQYRDATEHLIIVVKK